MATLGEAVSAARKAPGLSQRQLALRIKKENGEKISLQYLNDIVRERRCTQSQHPTLHFAKALKLEPDFLFGLAQVWPRHIAKGMERPSPETIHEAFRAFRRTLKDKK
jgi:transcriptional regulator with XRE-family HTH domain